MKEGLPIYLHARDSLVAEIDNGLLKAHDALPSERLLAEQLGISRMTARQALVELERAGYAYRKGKLGRYVADRRLSHDVGTSLSFAARALSESINLTIEVLSAETGAADNSLAAQLDIDPGTPVHTYRRLFRVDGRTALIERESAIAERFPDLLDQDLSQPSTLLHESRYGVIGSKGRVSIRCQKISDQDQLLFAADTPTYGLEMELIVIDTEGKPFCRCHQIWSSEMAEFTLLVAPDR